MNTTNSNNESSPTEGTIQVADIKMGYRIYGNGFPLILISGYGSTMELWEPGTINALATHYQVIIFDNRGIGQTEKGTKAFSIEQFSEDSCGLMDALGIKQAHVMGWSMGGMIAQELALQHPDRISKLILYGAHCGASMFPPRPEIIQMLTDLSGTPRERGMRYLGVLFSGEWMQNNGMRIGQIFGRPMGNISEDTVSQQSEAIEAWPGSADRLSGMRFPVLLISGADDNLVIAKNLEFMSSKIPNAQMELVENSGHGLMFQHPELFCEKVLGFLK